MGNLIRAEFYRIRCQRWGLLLLAALVLGGVVFLAAACGLPPQRGDAALLFQVLEYLFILGMFFAVPCADLASARVEGRHVLLKNEAVFGIPRWQMYLSRLCTALLLGTGLAAAMSLLALLLAAAFLPGLAQLPQVLFQYLLLLFTALPLWMASAGLFLSLKLILRSGAAAGMATGLYYLIGFPVLATAAMTTAGRENFLSLPALLYALHPMTPFWNEGMLMEELETGISIVISPEAFAQTPPPLLECWAIGGFWLILTSAAAIWVLNRRELR